MTATIITKNKTSSGTPSSLAQGELAVNIADKKLFVGGSGGSSVVDLEFEKFNGGTITSDLKIETGSTPTLSLASSAQPLSFTKIGKIGFDGTLSSGADLPDIAKIEAEYPFSLTTLPYSQMRFYVRNGSPSSMVEAIKIAYNGDIYMQPVYYDAVSGSTRDLYIKSNGQLGYLSSIRESKTNIEDLTDVSWIYSLNPVSFNYRDMETTLNEETNESVDTYLNTHSSELEYGLIAEDVKEVNNELVFYDDDELRGVSYKKLVVPMLKTIQDQKELIDALTARVTALENA
jgi:DNA-binding NarL/FixJ family response regulator